MVILTEKHKEEVINFYKKGLSLRTIASKLNISITPVKIILKENKINTKRTRWDYYEKRLNITKKELENLAKNNNSYEIAEMFDVSQPVVHYWIKKYGIKLKRKLLDKTKEKIRKTLLRKYKSGEIINPNKLPNNSKVMNNGYYWIKQNNTWLQEHRYIWLRDNDWGMLTIPYDWVVHHINGDKLDNKIENLACIPHSMHNKLHSTKYFKGGRRR